MFERGRRVGEEVVVGALVAVSLELQTAVVIRQAAVEVFDAAQQPELFGPGCFGAQAAAGGEEVEGVDVAGAGGDGEA
jgi:hypothetical protein